MKDLIKQRMENVRLQQQAWAMQDLWAELKAGKNLLPEKPLPRSRLIRARAGLSRHVLYLHLGPCRRT